MHPRLRWIHDVQLFRLFTFRTSASRYKWSMQMLRHRILIIPGNPQKTDFYTLFYSKTGSARTIQCQIPDLKVEVTGDPRQSIPNLKYLDSSRCE